MWFLYVQYYRYCTSHPRQYLVLNFQPFASWVNQTEPLLLESILNSNRVISVTILSTIYLSRILTTVSPLLDLLTLYVLCCLPFVLESSLVIIPCRRRPWFGLTASLWRWILIGVSLSHAVLTFRSECHVHLLVWWVARYPALSYCLNSDSVLN